MCHLQSAFCTPNNEIQLLLQPPGLHLNNIERDLQVLMSRRHVENIPEPVMSHLLLIIVQGAFSTKNISKCLTARSTLSTSIRITNGILLLCVGCVASHSLEQIWAVVVVR